MAIVLLDCLTEGAVILALIINPPGHFSHLRYNRFVNNSYSVTMLNQLKNVSYAAVVVILLNMETVSEVMCCALAAEREHFCMQSSIQVIRNYQRMLTALQVKERA